MPIIDVNIVLDDPMFTTLFDVQRYADVVDGNGVNHPTNVAFTSKVGVVEPSTSHELLRLPELERTSGTITLYTEFRLRLQDQIVWPSGGSETYTIATMDDYTQFGRGFVVAICRRDTIP